ncbi:Fatty acid desaturase [Macleaya cordata]|uniref:Fatty acid desaturase n=1 Tax=Macleaya cordata TaxID=56857 RepID=A0A200Q5S4_MACCD|nr:Fatty acid desaturase [Macleaya cordata]
MAATTTEGGGGGGSWKRNKLQQQEVFWKRKWTLTDAQNLGVIVLEHIGFLFAPFNFTWDAFWVAVMLLVLTGPFGISLSYHRNLAHRSFNLPKWLEYFFAYCGLHAAKRDPIFWVSTHRYHHQFTDTNRDPHSPIEGFWFSYITWMLDNNYIIEKCGEANNVMDLEMQTYYRFLQSTYHLHLFGLGLLLYLVGGFPYVIWGMCVRIAIVRHSTFMVNFVCHTWGQKPWNTNDLSKNNWLLGLVASGEGWHNNHHAFQFSARLGLEWWQIDLPWYFVKLLEYVGLATDVKVPSEIQKQRIGRERNMVQQQAVFWKRKWVYMDAMNLGVIVLGHIGFLFAPFYFTWDAFWVAVILSVVTGPVGISLSYHRNLTHRSFKLPKWLEYFFAYCGLQAGERDPIFWVSTHRYHHQFTDTDRDPHSPIEGFWFSHITWLFDHNYINEKCGEANNVMDLQNQAYYRFLQSTYHLHLFELGILLYVVGGFPYVFWGMGVRIVVVRHTTFMVNSVCHTWGQKPWNTNDLSKNNWLMGVVAFGEGWHNNHHAFQFSAR